MEPVISVILIVLMTYCDTLLIIGSKLRAAALRPAALSAAVFITLSLTHPVYSFIADSLSKTPGLRVASAAITLLFAFSLAGSRMAFRSFGDKSLPWVLWTLLWMDLIMSVDTILLISQSSPSIIVTVLGNSIGIAVLLLFTPYILRLLYRAIWIQVVAAGSMAYSAARQLSFDPYLSSFIHGPAVHMTGLIFICAVAFYGWNQIRRFY
ncbi:hypothetical protein [Paenibacillus thermotolerans]|uniref:hypothetical protein n=1 Tax=Paenibacillus thermotolerans TaxID=3027807 RepID=UPI0023685A42|nr:MULTISPECIES: hypothetical protein [unclassified Paenibacillus]